MGGGGVAHSCNPRQDILRNINQWKNWINKIDKYKSFFSPYNLEFLWFRLDFSRKEHEYMISHTILFTDFSSSTLLQSKDLH